MATTKKAVETKSETTKAKATVPSEVDKVADLEKIVKEQQEQMAQMAKLMEEMKSQKVVTVAPSQDLAGRKIKVISCIHNWLNLSTEPKGGGTIYEFPHFGYKHNIRFENLEKCVHNLRKSAERGDFYICDPEAVAELDLSEAYEHIFNADELDDILHFRNGEDDVDKIVGMAIYDKYRNEYTDTTARDNAIATIAENIAKGERYDLNLIGELRDKTGVDIDDLVTKAKEVIEIQKNA